MKKDVKFKELLVRYREGHCTETEYLEMIGLLKRYPELQALVDESVDEDWWAGLRSKERETLHEKSKVHPWARRHKISRILYSAAAAITLLAIAGAFWLYSNQGVLEYSTDYGEIRRVALPDGSTVTLNANSHLIWKKNWKRTGLRWVQLEGEAFFDVVKRERMQFDVHSNDLVIYVLGTSFNVSTRRNQAEVFLDKGQVKLRVANHEDVVMKPGEKVRYKAETRQLVKTANEAVHTAAAWKEGVISFRKERLEYILLELGDIYGKKIVCKDEFLKQTPMDVGVPYLKWEATRQALELAMDVEFQELGENHYLVKKK